MPSISRSVTGGRFAYVRFAIVNDAHSPGFRHCPVRDLQCHPPTTDRDVDLGMICSTS